MENTSIRLKQLMKERRLKQIDILNLAAPYCKQFNIKLNKSDLSQYISGKFAPGQWKITILGLALNVSEAWLMGYDVPRDRLPETTPPLPPNPVAYTRFSKNAEILFNAFNHLNCDGQQKLLDYAADLVASGRYDSELKVDSPPDIIPAQTVVHKLAIPELNEVTDALFTFDEQK